MEIMYFVHGTTFDNAEAKCSGWKQVELNELGKEQAIKLGKNTKYEFDNRYLDTESNDNKKMKG